MSTKVLFLDIDEVLNSNASALVYGGRGIDQCDPVKCGLIREIASRGVKIILSSTRRYDKRGLEFIQDALNIPISGMTPDLGGNRGAEIEDWIIDFEEATDGEVTHYAILDDDSFDILPSQTGNFVEVDGTEGLSWDNYLDVCRLLEVTPID